MVERLQLEEKFKKDVKTREAELREKERTIDETDGVWEKAFIPHSRVVSATTTSDPFRNRSRYKRSTFSNMKLKTGMDGRSWVWITVRHAKELKVTAYFA